MAVRKDSNYYKQLCNKLNGDVIKRRQMFRPPENENEKEKNGEEFDPLNSFDIEEDIIIENVLKDSKSLCNNKYIELIKKEQQKINSIRKKYCDRDGDGRGVYPLCAKDIEAYKLWKHAHTESDFIGSNKDTPTPMCYLANHRENRSAWVDYDSNIGQMSDSMKTSVVTSPFHKYMKYMYETYNEIK